MPDSARVSATGQGQNSINRSRSHQPLQTLRSEPASL